MTRGLISIYVSKHIKKMYKHFYTRKIKIFVNIYYQQIMNILLFKYKQIDYVYHIIIINKLDAIASVCTQFLILYDIILVVDDITILLS